MSEITFIKGKDRDLESSIEAMLARLKALDIEIEEASWLNPVPNVYSVHIRDRHCGLMFTNGKGASHKACLASALLPLLHEDRERATELAQQAIDEFPALFTAAHREGLAKKLGLATLDDADAELANRFFSPFFTSYTLKINIRKDDKTVWVVLFNIPDHGLQPVAVSATEVYHNGHIHIIHWIY